MRVIPPTTLGVRIFCGFLALLEFALALITSIVYYRRRNLFPLKGRGWRLMILAFSVVIIDAINVLAAVFAIDSYPSWLFASCYALAAVPASIIYMIRAWRLLFAFKLTDKMLELNELVEKGQFAKANTLTDSDWFVQHRHWLGPKATVLVFAVFFLLAMAASIIIVVEVKVSGQMELYISACTVAIISIAGSVAWFLRSYTGDGLYVKGELTITGLLSSILMSIYCCVWFPTGFFWFAPMCRLTVYLVSGVGAGVLPIIISYRVERQEKLMKKMDIDEELRKILLDPFGAESFLKFAKTEFSTENVLFWRDMEKVKSPSLTLPEVQDHLKRVYNTYISDSSTIQINLASDERQQLDISFAKLESLKDGSERAAFLEPWIEAQVKVFALMKKDSFPRYLQSPQYVEYQERKGTHVDIAVASHELTYLQHQSHRPTKAARNGNVEVSNHGPSRVSRASKASTDPIDENTV